MSRLSCGSRPDRARNWVVAATVDAGRETSTRTGLCRNCSVMRRISGGMVAVKEQRLPGERHQLADALDVGNEAHVEHAVGFVDDQKLDAGEQKPAALVMVEQPAGRRDQHVDAAGELGILIVEGNAADDQRDVELVIDAVSDEAFFHLRRELAGRFEDERARHAGTGAAAFPAWSASAARRPPSCRCRSARCQARRAGPARGGSPVLGWEWEFCNRTPQRRREPLSDKPR